LSLYLKGEITVTRPHAGGRKLRSITFTSSDQRVRAHALAAEQNLSLGRAIRLLALDQLIAEGASKDGGATGPVPRSGGYVSVVGSVDNSRTRIEARLSKTELQALTEKAEAGGFDSVQDLIVAVLRSFLTRSPVLDPTTVAAMGQANLSLVRIGTNLNQMAKVLNSGGVLSVADRQKFTEAMSTIEAHTRDIAQTLSQARGRWELVEQEQREGGVQ
jgi:hypothetical protein